jgi:hypothetical protein
MDVERILGKKSSKSLFCVDRVVTREKLLDGFR